MNDNYNCKNGYRLILNTSLYKPYDVSKYIDYPSKVAYEQLLQNKHISNITVNIIYKNNTIYKVDLVFLDQNNKVKKKELTLNEDSKNRTLI